MWVACSQSGRLVTGTTPPGATWRTGTRVDTARTNRHRLPPPSNTTSPWCGPRGCTGVRPRHLHYDGTRRGGGAVGCAAQCRHLGVLNDMARVVEVAVARLSKPLHTPFVTALRRTSMVTSAIVRLTDDEGQVGFGEAPQVWRVTGESLPGIEACVLGPLADALLTWDFDEPVGQLGAALRGGWSWRVSKHASTAGGRRREAPARPPPDSKRGVSALRQRSTTSRRQGCRRGSPPRTRTAAAA